MLVSTSYILELQVVSPALRPGDSYQHSNSEVKYGIHIIHV